MSDTKIGGAIDNPTIREEVVAVERLRYKWQNNCTSLKRSLAHEQCLNNSWYRHGLWAGGSKIQDLYMDIQRNGIRDPLIVYTTDEPGVYRVKLGNQRLAIARALGIETVRCKVVTQG